VLKRINDVGGVTKMMLTLFSTVRKLLFSRLLPTAAVWADLRHNPASESLSESHADK